jgi:hypothetical protein
MQPHLLLLYGAQLFASYAWAAPQRITPQPMTPYKTDPGTGGTTYMYFQKFHAFTDLTQHNLQSTKDLAKKCYKWLEENQRDPGVVNNDKKKAHAQIVAVTLFPSRNGGYAVAQNARGSGVDLARTEIRRDAPALKEAIGVMSNAQPIHAEVLSWLVGETKIKPTITQAGRQKRYPDGTVTIVYGRRSADFVVEDDAVKMDERGYPVVKPGTQPRELSSCIWSPETSCRDIGRALGVQILD